MYLSQAKIENFRGINEEISINFNQFNTIVGKNDAGKSTLLKALNLFLNDATFNKDDLNIGASDEIVSIEISLVPKEINQVLTSDYDEEIIFLDEILNNESKLEIKKVWDISGARTNCETFIFRKKYQENDFLLLSDRDFNSLCNRLEISEGLTHIEKRSEIKNKLDTDNVLYNYNYERLASSGSSKSKKINDAIKNILPKFEYFPADTSLSDSDAAIQNFFKRLAIKVIDEEVNRIELEQPIKDNLERVFSSITEKINNVVGEEESVEPEINFDWSKLVQTSFKSTNEDGSIPLSSRGDGFRRVTMMAYFEYLAEQQSTERQNILFGFEEPETFLHPAAQESLFTKLQAMCENGYQIMVTTHSPILVANSTTEDLIHVFKDEGKYKLNFNLKDVKDIADDLGIRVGNQLVRSLEKAKVLFLVEGIDDVMAFNYICDMYKKNELIEHTFDELGILPVPIGGCDSIKHWVALDLLKSIDKPFFIFLDSDKVYEEEESLNKKKLVEFGFQYQEDFLVSKKRELENYIPHSALARIVENFDEKYGNWEDVKHICKESELSGQLGGKKVVSRHFTKLTLEEIKNAFSDGTEDEFINVYNKLVSKLRGIS